MDEVVIGLDFLQRLLYFEARNSPFILDVGIPINTLFNRTTIPLYDSIFLEKKRAEEAKFQEILRKNQQKPYQNSLERNLKE